jgi:hypothetical protein
VGVGPSTRRIAHHLTRESSDSAKPDRRPKVVELSSICAVAPTFLKLTDSPLVPQLVPLEDGNCREVAEPGENDQAWSSGFFGPFFLVDGLALRGLIIRWSEVQVLPPPQHRVLTATCISRVDDAVEPQDRCFEPSGARPDDGTMPLIP